VPRARRSAREQFQQHRAAGGAHRDQRARLQGHRGRARARPPAGKFQTPDLHNAINEAFRIAERRLAQYKDQLRDRTAAAAHEDAHEYLGQVAELTPEKDFGFLLTASGGLLYFHRNSLLNGDFDRLMVGAQAYYVEEDGDTGPTARKVRVKA
jgi:cold shock CspA family protein